MNNRWNRTMTKLGTIIQCLIVLLVLDSHFLSILSASEKERDADNGSSFYMAINRPEGTSLFKWTELIYKEVFRRLGMTLFVEYYPLKRASIQANKGEVDGEPARIYSYGESYQNLLRVEEPVFSINVVAYAVDPEIPKLNGWGSLQNSTFTVEYPYGMKICEDNLTKVLQKEQIHSIKSSLQGLDRLVARRVDLYVDDLNSTTPLIENEKNGLKNKVRIAGLMDSTPLYMYIHAKHRKLRPRLQSIIKEIKSEGLVEHYRQLAFTTKTD